MGGKREKGGERKEEGMEGRKEEKNGARVVWQSFLVVL